MRGEGGNNEDRVGGEERDKPHLDEGFQWSEEGAFKCRIWKTGLQVRGRPC